MKKNILAFIITILVLFIIPFLVGLLFKKVEDFGITHVWLTGIGISFLTVSFLFLIFIFFTWLKERVL